ncbi:MAG TPA: sulfotransferase [Rhizomicrobium sp.]
MTEAIARELQQAAEKLSSDPKGAMEICRMIVAGQPENIAAWRLLSEAALHIGDHGAALEAAQAARKCDPTSAELAVHEAKCLALSGARREALALARAQAGAALTAAQHDTLGTVFSLSGDQEAAQIHFEKAVALSPGNAVFLYNLAATERMTGHLAEAVRHCDAVLAASPRDYRAHFLRADLRAWSKDKNHIEQMAALFDPAAADWRGMVLLGFALAKECDDLSLHDCAFGYLKAASDLQGLHMRYSVNADISAIDAIIAAHSHDAIAAVARKAGGKEAIFVIGLPRSGTTLVERMLTNHPDVVSVEEPSDFVAALMEVARTAHIPPGKDTLIRGSLLLDLDRVAQRYLERVRPEGSFPRFIDKFPQNYLYAGLIHAALPDAKIVLLRREPMDSCFAMYRAFFSGAYPFSYDLGELAQYYVAFDRLCTHWRATLPKSVLMELQYEDLVRNPESTARELLAFVGLSWSDAVAQPHKNEHAATTASAVQVRAPIHSRSVAKWRRYARHLEPLRAALGKLVD